MRDWDIPGSAGRPIHGTTHDPVGRCRGVVFLGHGFKGYKDYGFLPWLSVRLAEAGMVVHRFNFSHSGMLPGHGPFDPIAFQEDTWNRQVEDLLALIGAVEDGRISGEDHPIIVVGHSRGGVSSLLLAGRHAGTVPLASLAGVASLASPSQCLNLSEGDQATLLAEGSLASPSSRTGQELHVGSEFLQQQRDDPEGHDLLAQVARIQVPLCIVHGTEDDAVPVEASSRIAAAATSPARVHLLEGANHVFNAPNPFPVEAEPPGPLADLGETLSSWCLEQCEA